MIESVERAHDGESAVVLPTMGGSVPLWAFTDILERPTIVVPYANANNRQHSPNEHLRLDYLYQGVLTTARLQFVPQLRCHLTLAQQCDNLTKHGIARFGQAVSQ